MNAHAYERALIKSQSLGQSLPRAMMATQTTCPDSVLSRIFNKSSRTARNDMIKDLTFIVPD